MLTEGQTMCVFPIEHFSEINRDLNSEILPPLLWTRLYTPQINMQHCSQQH